VMVVHLQMIALGINVRIRPNIPNVPDTVGFMLNAIYTDMRQFIPDQHSPAGMLGYNGVIEHIFAQPVNLFLGCLMIASRFTAMTDILPNKVDVDVIPKLAADVIICSHNTLETLALH